MRNSSEVLSATKERWILSIDYDRSGSFGFQDIYGLISYVFHAPIDAFISIINLSYVALPSFHQSLGLPLMQYGGWLVSLLSAFFWAGMYVMVMAPFRARRAREANKASSPALSLSRPQMRQGKRGSLPVRQKPRTHPDQANALAAGTRHLFHKEKPFNRSQKLSNFLWLRDQK